jgi:putative lipoprotein
MVKPFAWALTLVSAISLALAAQSPPVARPPAAPGFSPRTDYACGTAGGRVSVWYEPKVAVLFMDGRLERFAAVQGSTGKYRSGSFDWTTNGNGATYAAALQSRPSQQECHRLPLSSWRPSLAAERYTCEDGLPAEFSPTLEAATLVIRGETYRLREVPTASGNLYTDGVRAWRGAAASRTFAEADGDAVFARGCRPSVMNNTATLTGTVTYRTRQALPAGTVLDARLLDVSRADAPSTPLARAVVVTTGEQVPLPFTLTYAPAVIERGHRYIVEATLTLDGRTRFRTTTMHPVLEDGTQAGPVEIVVQPIR